MVDEITFQAGEFSSVIRFYKTPEKLLDGAQLTVFDAHTENIVPGFQGAKHVWPAGEEFKVWPQVDSLLKAALEAGLARDSVLMGVGGGVVTDMAAFAASLYMRGCRLTLVPTTLLAMVDAAVGGKTGIDYHGYKNLVGTFYPAQELRIWPGVLQTLPERDFRSGLAEVIKHAMLAEPVLWDILKKEKDAILKRDPAVIDELVYRAVMVKVRVVERDLRETGERAFLNLGHTFGHALEAVLGFDGSWTHGEAVAWGVCRALDLGVTLRLTDPSYRDEARRLFEDYGFRLSVKSVDAKAVLEAMKKDKKKKSGSVRFVLQKKLGETFQQVIEDADVLESIKQGIT